MHTDTHRLLHDPDALIEAELPLDREPYESLVKAVLRWSGPDTLTTRDYEQIALQLTGHARALAAAVQRHTHLLAADNPRRVLADVVVEETQRRLSVPLEGTARCVQNRARMVRALYERFDRLTETAAPDADGW